MTLREKIVETLRDNPYVHLEASSSADIIIDWFKKQIDNIEMLDDTGYRDARSCYAYEADLEKIIG